MNQMKNLLDCVAANIQIRPSIHGNIRAELEAFTKPTIDPSDYKVTPKLAALLLIVSRHFRNQMGSDLCCRFDAVCQEAAARWLEHYPEDDKTKEFTGMISQHVYYPEK